MQTVYARDNWGPRKEAAQDTAHDGNFDLADRKLQRAYCNYSRVTPYTSASCALLFELAPETLTGRSAFPQIAHTFTLFADSYATTETIQRLYTQLEGQSRTLLRISRKCLRMRENSVD